MFFFSFFFCSTRQTSLPFFHSSPAPIDVLYELSQKRPDLVHNPKFEVYIDGGVRRGTDVLKALCLGEFVIF